MNILINGTTLDKTPLLKLLKRGRKIQAVKYVSEQTGLGLRESKDIVEKLLRKPDFYDQNSSENSGRPKSFAAKKNASSIKRKSPFILYKSRPLSYYVFLSLLFTGLITYICYKLLK